MTDDIVFTSAQVLFCVCIGIVLLVAVLSLLAYHRVTRGARILELILIWVVAVGGSMVGSFITGILFYLDGVNHPEHSYAAQFAAVFGMFLSIPIGVVGGGLAGTMLAALLVYLHTWRPTLIACAGALVMAALISGVALVPIDWFLFAIATI